MERDGGGSLSSIVLREGVPHEELGGKDGFSPRHERRVHPSGLRGRLSPPEVPRGPTWVITGTTSRVTGTDDRLKEESSEVLSQDRSRGDTESYLL